MFRGVGLRDGMWTIATSAGTKVQTLAITAIAGWVGGYEGVGEILLAVSIGILASAVADLGLSTQVVRLFSTGTALSPLQAVLPTLLRAVISLPLAAVLAGLALVPKFTGVTGAGWVGGVVLYACGLVFGGVTTQIVYGQGRFRNGAIAVGVARGVSSALLIVAALVALPGWVALLVLALVEFAIAGIQLRQSGALGIAWTRESLTPHSEFRLGRTVGFAVGPIANTIVNRSDLIVVALFLSSAQLGLYGLASQIENALTTIALIPAGAAVAHAARARELSSTLTRQRAALVTIVGTAYIIETLVLIVLLAPIVNVVFGLELVNPVPIWFCMAAGLFSCIAGVAMQQITGQGSARRAAVVWLSSLLLGATALVVGSMTGTATGVAVGALIRDVGFFALAWSALISMKQQEAT